MGKNQNDEDPIETPIKFNIVTEMQKDLKVKVKGSRYLSPKTVSIGPQQLAHFDRRELKLGSLVGIGTFSEIYELEGFNLKSRFNNILKSKEYKLSRRKIILKTSNELSQEKRPFVVKHLRSSLLAKQHEFSLAANELVLEANYLATFDHPNIISIHGVASGGVRTYTESNYDAFFILLDRVECTLSDRMIKWKNAESSISFAERLVIIKDLTSAAVFLHDRHFVYRDFKPANVGFDVSGKVKLLDFGLIAEIPKEEKYLTKRVGTPRYMAPECYMEKPYDNKVDVYSITAMLWEVLAIQRYFDYLDAERHIFYVFYNGIRETLYSNWPAEIRSILAEGWSAEANQRMTMKDFCIRITKEIENLRLKKMLDDKMIVDKSENNHVPQAKSLSDETECTDITEETMKFGIKIEI